MQDVKYSKSQEDFRRLIVDLLPNLPLYNDKNDSTKDLYKFCDSIGAILAFFDKDWQNIYDTSFIKNANINSIIKWENELNLPDNIFTENKDLAIRIQQCLIKKWISDFGVSKTTDYYQLASYLGFDNILIEFSGESISAVTFDYTFDSIYFDDITTEEFTWIVHLPSEYSNTNDSFDTEFDYEFTGNADVLKLILLFKKVRPQYVNIIYVYDL